MVSFLKKIIPLIQKNDSILEFATSLRLSNVLKFSEGELRILQHFVEHSDPLSDLYICEDMFGSQRISGESFFMMLDFVVQTEAARFLVSEFVRFLVEGDTFQSKRDFPILSFSKSLFDLFYAEPDILSRFLRRLTFKDSQIEGLEDLSVFYSLPYGFRFHPDVGLHFVNRYWRFIEESPVFRDNETIAFAALRQDLQAFRYLSPRLQRALSISNFLVNEPKFISGLFVSYMESVLEQYALDMELYS